MQNMNREKPLFRHHHTCGNGLAFWYCLPKRKISHPYIYKGTAGVPTLSVASCPYLLSHLFQSCGPPTTFKEASGTTILLSNLYFVFDCNNPFHRSFYYRIRIHLCFREILAQFIENATATTFYAMLPVAAAGNQGGTGPNLPCCFDGNPNHCNLLQTMRCVFLGACDGINTKTG